MALLTQWLLELTFAGGASPEELGRHLLKGWLGKHGYAGIANSQRICNGTENDSGVVRRHTGSALQRTPRASAIPAARISTPSLPVECAWAPSTTG